MISRQSASRRPTAVLALLIGVGFALSACTQLQAPASPEPPEPSATAPASPGPAEETPADGEQLDITIPSCDELITPAEARDLFAADFESGLGPSPESREEIRRSRLGPDAVSAYEQVTEFVPCYWGVPLSGLIEHLFVAELPSDVRAELLTSLRASAYDETSADGIALFSYTFGEPRATTWYGFVGDIWVASFGERGSVPIELVFDKLRAANPEWVAQAP